MTVRPERYIVCRDSRAAINDVTGEDDLWAMSLDHTDVMSRSDGRWQTAPVCVVLSVVVLAAEFFSDL